MKKLTSIIIVSVVFFLRDRSRGRSNGGARLERFVENF
jgi:hypothetical protein